MDILALRINARFKKYFLVLIQKMQNQKTIDKAGGDVYNSINDETERDLYGYKRGSVLCPGEKYQF